MFIRRLAVRFQLVHVLLGEIQKTSYSLVVQPYIKFICEQWNNS